MEIILGIIGKSLKTIKELKNLFNTVSLLSYAAIFLEFNRGKAYFTV